MTDVLERLICDFLSQFSATLTPIASTQEGKLGLVVTLRPMLEGGISLAAQSAWTAPLHRQ
jgi:GTP cyclohydrolase II